MHKDNQRAKAWESTVRKTQQQQQQLLLSSGRRRGLIFQSMSVAPAADDESSSSSPTTTTSTSDPEPDDSELVHAEKLLPNGDFYTGYWHNQLPHGSGKYLWTDGCMYEGAWRFGKTMGIGKFSWPSGATYEGDFKSGFMDGSGTYIGTNGDTYKGGWSMNLKHGNGKKSYANGDCYDGEWRNGLQDGHGRYIWKNGNEYVGQWRSGIIHGRGSLIWANGNRYDGGWEDGIPMGNGSFRWGDGSLYIGIWSGGGGGGGDGEEEHKGIYYPSPAATSPTARDPQLIFDRELADCKICPGETVSILPSQKRLNWSGMEMMDASSSFEKQAAGGHRMMAKGPDAPPPRPRRRGSVEMGAQSRKPNGRVHTVIGTNNGNNGGGGGGGGGERMMGAWDSDGDINCDVVDESGRRSVDLRSVVVVGGSRREDGEGRRSQPSKWTPRAVKKQGETISKGHKNYDLMLNLQLGIRHAVGRQAAQAATTDLKSSAFDPKEKVWTKFPPEGSKHTPPHQSCDFRWKDYCPLVFRTLRRLFKVDAADYMISLCGNDALRELSSPGKSGSFFYLTNDDRYMIKTMKKAEVKVLLRMLPAYFNHVRSYDNTLITKFFGLHCVKLTGAAQKKVRFVIMGNLFCSEYAIHRRFDLKGSSHGRTTDKPESEINENTTLKDLDLNFIFRLQKSWFQEFRRQVDKDCELLEQERIMDYSLLVGLHFRDTSGNTEDMDQLHSGSTRSAQLRLGISMPARVEQTVRKNEGELIGEPTGEIYDVVLFFGIIDILQDYDISKKLEHAYKSFQYDPTSISAVDPKQYAKRFKDFIHKAFAEDT